MPLYEYACKVCDHHFDIRHGANELPALQCPECQGEVRKVFHAAGIIFKGSGWYITDSAKKSSLPEGSAEKADDATEKAAATPEKTDTAQPAATEKSTAAKPSTSAKPEPEPVAQ